MIPLQTAHIHNASCAIYITWHAYIYVVRRPQFGFLQRHNKGIGQCTSETLTIDNTTKCIYKGDVLETNIKNVPYSSVPDVRLREVSSVFWLTNDNLLQAYLLSDNCHWLWSGSVILYTIHCVVWYPCGIFIHFKILNIPPPCDEPCHWENIKNSCYRGVILSNV